MFDSERKDNPLPKTKSNEVYCHNKSDVDLKLLGQKYFNLWVATQAVNATEKDINNYLNVLVQNLGHQHLPYGTDDSRDVYGKRNMRKGMLY